MALSSKLDRKLRAAEESSDDSENYEVTDRSSSESVLDTGAGGEIMTSDDDSDDDRHVDHDDEMVRPTSPSNPLPLTRRSRTYPTTTKCRRR
jgi:hypothetical protein